jgi:adenosylmethionine-8-amino-7-oxononanoate aminotransferase
MRTTPQDVTAGGGGDPSRLEAARALEQAARRHLWMHFTRMGAYGAEHEVPVIERGEGPYVWDAHGRRYLDGLAGLFVVQVGHGRHELAEAAAKQAAQLAYFPVWSYAHPASITLAERLAAMAATRCSAVTSPITARRWAPCR